MNNNNNNRRGRRNNRRGGFQRQNIQIQVPNVLTEQQIIDIIKREQTKEKAVYSEKPDTITDVSSKTWDDLDRELEWIEEKYENETMYATKHDCVNTVYTDAWDARPIMDFAIALYKASGIGSVMTNVHSIDIVGFCGYVCALAETYLLANDEIVGVAGFTRQECTQARALLQQQTVPEMIALMFLQLRPTQLPDGTKIVLLPHTFDRAAGARAGQITWLPAGGIDIDLHQHRFWVRTIQGALGVAQNHANANLVRTNWMEILIDQAAQAVGEDYYFPHNLNLMTDGARLLQLYATCARTEELFDPANNVLFTTHPWDVWFGYDAQSYFASCFKRKYVGFGNRACYSTLAKKEIPIVIADAQGSISMEPKSSKERWMPWFRCDNAAHVTAFVDEVRAQVGTCIMNYQHYTTRHHVNAEARAARCFNLALGHGNAMIADPLA